MSSILKSMNWHKLTLVVLGQRRQTDQKQKKHLNKHAYLRCCKSEKFSFTVAVMDAAIVDFTATKTESCGSIP